LLFFESEYHSKTYVPYGKALSLFLYAYAGFPLKCFDLIVVNKITFNRKF